MHRFVASAAFGLSLAALAAGADGGNAPLAESKQELQKLKAQAGSGSTQSVKDGLKGSLPTFQAPTDSAAAFQRLSPEQLQRDSRERGDAQRNWLVNGVNELAKKKDRFGDDKAEPEEAGKIDTTDPAYLVKLYEKQRKASETKAAGTDGKTARTPQADPFAPFLQGWLAGSPVKDQILSETNRSPAGTLDIFKQTALPGQSVHAATPASALQGGALGPGPKANPYLAEASPTGLPNLGSPTAAPTPVATPATALGTPPAPPPALSLQPLPEPVKNDRKSPPAPLADDKKYFPQLKKF